MIREMFDGWAQTLMVETRIKTHILSGAVPFLERGRDVKRDGVSLYRRTEQISRPARPEYSGASAMTPDTIAEAIYEIGQAAATELDARLIGADLGHMLAAQLWAVGVAREQLHCASATEIELILTRLAAEKIPHHAAVAVAALEVLRREGHDGRLGVRFTAS